MSQMVSYHLSIPETVLTNIYSALALVRHQISETNELRGSIHKLDIATRLALQKAETARAKKAAGGSKGMCYVYTILNSIYVLNMYTSHCR